MSDIQAFPCDRRTNWMAPGMTLRDYFAAKALAGYWADAGPDISAEGCDITAQQCYQIADAMLKAREPK